MRSQNVSRKKGYLPVFDLTIPGEASGTAAHCNVDLCMMKHKRVYISITSDFSHEEKKQPNMSIFPVNTSCTNFSPN